MTGPRDDGDREEPSVHSQMVAGAHLRQGWDALGMLISGVLVFGLPAWWVSEATGQIWVVPVALVLGMAAGIYTVLVRYSDDGP